MGREQKPHALPWLTGKEEEKKRLDETVHVKNVEWRQLQRGWQEGQNVTEERVSDAKKQMRKASRDRRRQLRAWEKAWWVDIGEKASEAARVGNTGDLFKILRVLQLRDEEGRKDGGKKSAANVEEERESWKEHFKKVSEDRGNVNPRVWDNVKKSGYTAEWMSKEPSDIELEVCLGKMKVKKKPGKDGMMVEAIKYGGEGLKSRVFETVRTMWRRAVEANEGEESMSWPEDWNVGLVIPLWKKKGEYKDKNTWRGITLLSVGVKLLARVVATRLGQWAGEFMSEEQCVSTMP